MRTLTAIILAAIVGLNSGCGKEDIATPVPTHSIVAAETPRDPYEPLFKSVPKEIAMAYDRQRFTDNEIGKLYLGGVMPKIADQYNTSFTTDDIAYLYTKVSPDDANAFIDVTEKCAQLVRDYNNDFGCPDDFNLVIDAYDILFLKEHGITPEKVKACIEDKIIDYLLSN